MDGLSRRRVIRGAAAGAAVVGTTGLGAAPTASARSGSVLPGTAEPAEPTVSTERRRAVVIGCGFGGAISALHLGRAGVDTLVLERGQWWNSGGYDTFPGAFPPDGRLSWLETLTTFPGLPTIPTGRQAGLLELVVGDGMSCLVAAGVGGGSLLYQGMSPQPSEANFRKAVSQTHDYQLLDEVYYPRVARMLNLQTIPDDVLDHPRYRSTKMLWDRGLKIGMEPFKVPMPLDWEQVRSELAGRARPVISNGDTLFGVNGPGKFSVDRTYVPAALATGSVEVAPLHVVRSVKRVGDRWEVVAERIDTTGRVLHRRIVTTDAVFLNAGSVNTTKMLVNARARGWIPGLPEGLGTRWGNNGERVCAVTSLLHSPGMLQGGPSCIGVKDWDNPVSPITIVTGPMPFPVDVATMTVIGLGITRPAGRWVYDAHLDDAVLHWDNSDNAAVAEEIRRIIHRMYPEPLTSIVDTNQLVETTFHPLGGATFGHVCDDLGRVHDQPGLYIGDGALIPGNTGAVNPSLTIAALAEHAMDRIVRQDLGRVF